MTRLKLDNQNQRGPLSSSGKGGKGCAVLFGLAFGGAGLAALFFIGRSFIENVAAYSWDEAPCELISCEVAIDESNPDDPFSMVVDYRYTVDGQDYRSTRHTLGTIFAGNDDYTPLARERDRLLAARAGDDAGLVAYVDPEDPASAILKRQPLWAGALSLLFPLPFLLVGFGMVYFTLFSKSARRATTATSSAGSSLSSSSQGTGRNIARAVCALVFLGGVAATWPLGIKPIVRASDARSWPATPCTILWSRVQSHDSDDGTTYSVDIFYEYEFDEVLYRSNRYGFVGGSSSGYDSKRDIVNAHPKGSTQTCYVDPDDPYYAVLKPKLGFGVLLALIPAALLLIGGIGLAATRKPTHQRSGLSSADRHDHESPLDDGRRVLQPGLGRLGSFSCALGIALFWNGIVSVFLWQVIESFQRGKPEWFLVVFLIPFVLVGLAMIAAVFYTLMAQFNPRPVVTLTPGTPRLGDTLHLSWQLSGGRSGRLQNLRIVLAGNEKATYRRGTNTATDTRTFYRRVIAEAGHGFDLLRGEGRLELPPDLCPSLDLGNNAIAWRIEVQGEIPFWPDLNDHYDITLKAQRS